MSTVSIRLLGDGDCAVRHLDSGAELRTSKAPEYGGRGASFSSTDLLGVALGTCIATDIEPVALRHGLAPGDFEVEVRKRISTAPKQVEGFDVTVRVARALDPLLAQKLTRASETCLVRRSLDPGVECRVTLTW